LFSLINLLKLHVDTLHNATSILFQHKYDKDKISSLHKPHVECIAKGKAHKRGTKVVEDCSQAPGAVCANQKVGSFGDIAAYATMYHKTLSQYFEYVLLPH
jgi:hypothetical protein